MRLAKVFNRRFTIVIILIFVGVLAGGLWLTLGRKYFESKHRAQRVVELLQTGFAKDVGKADNVLLGYPDGVFDRLLSEVKPQPLRSKDAEMVKRAVLNGLASSSDMEMLWMLLHIVMDPPSRTGITYSDDDWLVIESAVEKCNALLDKKWSPWRVDINPDGSRDIMPPMLPMH